MRNCMLAKTNYFVPIELLREALDNLPDDTYRITLNNPSGDFFYDLWTIKDEFKGTVWDKLLSALKEPLGEARIIKLESGQSYWSHADIDDRWHLSLSGNESYLIDLQSYELHKTQQDGIWYNMDAGKLHTAANFGQVPRLQLVVRQLLKRTILTNPVKIAISKAEDVFDYRYQFDHVLSPYLNTINKQGIINNFSYKDDVVIFEIESAHVANLQDVVPKIFKVEVC